jgi:hypothetical protein
MLSSVDGSFTAASPCRRSGSKCESTSSSIPLEPVLGSAVSGTVTWFTVYWMFRYQTSIPGALYGTCFTDHSPVSRRR